MVSKKKGLGRGLSALLDDSAAELPLGNGSTGLPRTSGSITEIPIEQIEPNPFQPRTVFSTDALVELAASIRELGIIQPVTLRKVRPDHYQLISGERRFRASQAAGLMTIPAYIRLANDEAMLEMALVENIQREELDAIEIAISFQRLIDECDLSQEALSEKVGKERSTVANYLRLLKLPPEIQLGLRQKHIGMGHARALISVKDPQKQIALFRMIVESKLSVRQVEELAKDRSKRAGTHANKMSTSHQHLAKVLGKELGTRVAVKSNATGKGPHRDQLQGRNRVGADHRSLGCLNHAKSASHFSILTPLPCRAERPLC